MEIKLTEQEIDDIVTALQACVDEFIGTDYEQDYERRAIALTHKLGRIWEVIGNE